MSAKRKSMTAEHASKVKLAGHKNEEVFAGFIQGDVQRGTQTAKKDVIDSKHRFHSVKSGKWWQIFLYAKSRFENNTAFRGIGDLAPLMVECIDAFPESREEYLQNKKDAKTALQNPMRQLCNELCKPRLFEAFLDKVLFNGGEVNYLSILPPKDYPTDSDKVFHIFSNNDVVRVLSMLEIANSKARTADEMDAQKVLFKRGHNLGEIEIRNDSKFHYRQAKCRFKSTGITTYLLDELGDPVKLTENILAYGEAINTMRWLKN